LPLLLKAPSDRGRKRRRVEHVLDFGARHGILVLAK
jgi:hypothetical protein